MKRNLLFILCTCCCIVLQAQITVNTQDLTVFLDATGNASITPQQINNGSTDENGDPITNLSLDRSSFDCDDTGVINYGNSLEVLSGTNGMVSINDLTGAPIGNAARSMSIWYKPSSFDFSYGGILSYGRDDCNFKMFGLGMTATGEVQYWTGCNGPLTGLQLKLNQWNHLTAVYDGAGTTTIYLNGNTATFTGQTLGTVNGKIFAGVETIDNGGFYRNSNHGSFDEIKLYNRALSASEVSSLLSGQEPDNSALVAYYPFTNALQDEAGSNNANFVGAGSSVGVASPTLQIGNIVTLTATATSGASSFATANVIVVDNNNAVLNCASDLSIYTTDNNGAVVDYGLPTINISCQNNGAAVPGENLIAPAGTSFVGAYKGSMYFISDTADTLINNYATAASLGQTLVAIDNQEENDYLFNLLSGIGDNTIQIGLDDIATEGTFVWQDGTALNYTNWNANEPNNSGGNEDYTQMILSGGAGGLWNDAGASGTARFLIEMNKADIQQPDATTFLGTFGGHSYFISTSAVLPAQVFSTVAANGYQLLSIDDATENAFITSRIGAYSLGVLFGLNDVALEGTFVNQDGSIPSYTNWNTGEPNNSGGMEDYSVILTNGAWNDIGDSARHYIIEMPTNFVQTAGLITGEQFPIGTTTNSFAYYQEDGTTANCATQVDVTLDTTAPALTSVSISSNNSSNSTIAKAGDRILLGFTASEDLSNATVTIAGQTAQVVQNGNAATWQASLAIPRVQFLSLADVPNGTVAFAIDFEDLAGIAGTQVVAVTDATQVTIDRTPPVVRTQNAAFCPDVNGNYTLAIADIDNGTTDPDGAVTLSLETALTTNRPAITYNGTHVNKGSFYFDGNDKRTQASANLPTGNAARTFEFWAKSENTGSSFQYMLDSGAASTSSRFTIRFDNSGAITVLFFGAGRVVSFPSAHAYNVWAHFSLTYDNRVLRLYKNGQLLYQRGINFDLNTAASDLYLGNLFNALNADFRGNVAELKVFNYARTGQEIASEWNTYSAGNEPGLVYYNKLNEGTGNAVDDSRFNTGGDFPATGAGEPIWSTDYPTTSFQNKIGTYHVTLSAVDTDNNIVSEDAVFVLNDDTPTARGQDIVVALDATGNASITPADIENGSTNSCSSSNLTFSIDRNTFDCSDITNGSAVASQLVVNGVSAGGASEVWQSFTSNVATELAWIEVLMRRPNTSVNSNISIEVYEGAGLNGTLLGTSENSVTLTPADTSLAPYQFNFDGISLTENEQYTFNVVSSSPSNTTWIPVSSGGRYPNGNSSLNPTLDLRFSITALPVRIPVTLTATTDTGFSDSTTVYVSLEDSTAPVISLTGDSTITLALNDTYVEQGATASDNCSLATGGVVIDNSAIDTTQNGTYLVTYNIDDFSGNAATEVTRTVIIDGTAPQIATATISSDNSTDAAFAKAGDHIILTFTTNEEVLLPAVTIAGRTATVSATGNTNEFTAQVFIPNVNAADQSVLPDGAVSFEVDLVDVFTNAVQNLTGTTDGSSVTIDRTAPILSVQNTTATLDASGNASIVEADVVTNLIESNIENVSISTTSFDCNDSGTQGVLITALDKAGNQDSQVALVQVEDLSAPVLQLIGAASITVQRGTAYNDLGVTIMDNCAGVITPVIGGDVVDTNTSGMYTVRYNAVDPAGNAATEITRTVEVTNGDYIYESGAWTPNAPDNPVNLSSLADNIIVRENVTLSNDVKAHDLRVEAGAILSLASGVEVTVDNEVQAAGLNATDASLVAYGQTLGTTWSLQNTEIGTLELANSNLTITGDIDVRQAISNNDTVSSSTLNVIGANLTLKSDAAGTAVVDGAQLNILGEVTIEQYFADRRAYRFLSIPVTSTTSIFDNLQQGGLNLGDAGYQSGYGTHITGTAAPLNGLDPTATNNPSMYTWSNVNQTWNAKSSTNLPSDVLVAGDFYRLMVRGDREIDLNNNLSSSSTTLRMTGSLLNTDFSLPSVSANNGEFMILTNPYQSNMDMASKLNELFNGTSSDLSALDPSLYYVWDPMANERGAYRVYSRQLNTLIGASVMDSNYLPGIIKPGQAMFVIASGTAGGNVVLTRTPNTISPPGFTTNNTGLLGSISLQLYEQNAYQNGNGSLDGLMIRFTQNGDNNITNDDATKISNLDENIARMDVGGTMLIIEERAQPYDSEELALFINNLRHSHYTIEVRPTEFVGVTAYIEDKYTQTLTPLDPNQSTTYNFAVDANPASTASDRFKIVFENVLLSSGDTAFAKAIQLYPNPVAGDQFYLDLGDRIGEKRIVLTTLQGQIIREIETSNTGIIECDINDLSSALYLIQVHHEGTKTTFKLIVE